MKKNFVLDTNVILHDPKAIFSFGKNNVIIPIYVIEEIDNFKKDLNELGRNARQFSRQLDEYQKEGNLREGVSMENGGEIRVVFTSRTVPSYFKNQQPADNLIIATALDIQDKEPESDVIFITKDTNLRIRANALGLKSVNFEPKEVSLEELYPGSCEASVPASIIDQLYSTGHVEINGNGLHFEHEDNLLPNEYVLLRNMAEPSRTALARVSADGEELFPLRVPRQGVCSIFPRNREQRYALDCLLDDSIPVVTLVGKAGTGKTLLALAAGLYKVTEENRYRRMLVSRPIFPLGRDLGYLPGDLEQKLNPWMQPIFDNLERLMGLEPEDLKAGRGPKEYIEMGMVQVEPLTYIRGRSIPNQYIIVDESQNLTPHEVKTILTRAGDGTKIVLTGDPYQIDNPYVDSESNGLTYIVERFKGKDLAATVTLSKGERSKLAEMAANLL